MKLPGSCIEVRTCLRVCVCGETEDIRRRGIFRTPGPICVVVSLHRTHLLDKPGPLSKFLQVRDFRCYKLPVLRNRIT